MSGFVRSVWASIQGDPAFMERLNGWLTVFWIVMIPLSIATHWINSTAETVMIKNMQEMQGRSTT